MTIQEGHTRRRGPQRGSGPGPYRRAIFGEEDKEDEKEKEEQQKEKSKNHSQTFGNEFSINVKLSRKTAFESPNIATPHTLKSEMT